MCTGEHQRRLQEDGGMRTQWCQPHLGTFKHCWPLTLLTSSNNLTSSTPESIRKKLPLIPFNNHHNSVIYGLSPRKYTSLPTPIPNMDNDLVMGFVVLLWHKNLVHPATCVALDSTGTYNPMRNTPSTWFYKTEIAPHPAPPSNLPQSSC